MKKNMVAMISGCDRYCQGGQNRYFLGGTRLGLGVAIGVLPLQDTLSARDDHSFAQKKYIIRSYVKKQSTKLMMTKIPSKSVVGQLTHGHVKGNK